MNLCHIVAMDQKRVIGRDGEMPWYLPEDLKRFKRLTMGHCMIMGRKTFESIGKALPGRTSIVVSRQQNLELEGATVVSSIDQARGTALKLVKDPEEMVFIIGGGELYRQTLPCVDVIHLTKIERDVGGGDAYYPELPGDDFTLVEDVVPEGVQSEPFRFQTYKRVR